MAPGVGLGVALICLVLAEHVCCSGATQARCSQRQNSDGYVGFSQQDGGLGRPGGGSPQDQLRRASGLSSATNAETAVRGSSPKVYRICVPRTLRSRSKKPELSLASDARKVPQNPYGLSTSIAGASSFSRHGKNQNRLGEGRRTWEVLRSPPRKTESAAQKTGRAAAERPSNDEARPYFPQRSFLFGSGPLLPGRMQTSASAPGRKVSSGRGSKPSQALEPPSLHHRKWTPGFSQRLQPSWNVRPPTKAAPDLPNNGGGTSGQHFAPTKTYSIPLRFGGYAIRRLAELADQKEASIRKPQAPPSRQIGSSETRVQGAHPKALWKRFRPSWSLTVGSQDVRKKN